MRISFLALGLLLAVSRSLAVIETETVIGWEGQRTGRKLTAAMLRGGKEAIVIDPSKVKQLSWKPRAFLYEGFLTPNECDHVIELSMPKLEISMVTDNDSGEALKSEIRTSSGAFLDNEDDIIDRIDRKIAAWTFIPRENGEAMQVLRYNYGQKYDAHYDYFHDKVNIQMGGHRYATVLMYLSDVERGGETVFPNAQDVNSKYDDSWSDCAKQGLAVKPRKGDALLFFSLHPDATTDDTSLHAGCPVISGEKWSATKWIHVKSFDTGSQAQARDPSVCEDNHEQCPDWAASGECTKNAAYMVGEGVYVGNCRKSCKVCGNETS